MQTKTYSNPPIIEAICAFQFIPSQPWDATVLGLVYDRLKGQFPVKALAPGPLLNVTIGATPPSGIGRMQFRRTDNSALVQLGPDSLTVNHLTPYCGWPSFQKMIETALEAYKLVAAPQGLSAVTLRYINRLNIPADNEDGVDIRQYVLTHPIVPDSVPQMFLEWAQRVVIPFEEAQQSLIIQVGTTQGNDEFPVVFMLDIEARHDEEAVSLAEANTWLEAAHLNVETVFESCVGPKARLLFGEEVESV